MIFCSAKLQNKLDIHIFSFLFCVDFAFSCIRMTMQNYPLNAGICPLSLSIVSLAMTALLMPSQCSSTSSYWMTIRLA